MKKLLALCFLLLFCASFLEAQTSPPVFSPASGTYSAHQIVTLSNPSSAPLVCFGPNPNIVIGGASTCPLPTQQWFSSWYPTCGSGTCTYYAVAGGTGFADSTVSSATYTITITGTTINYPVGTGFGASCDGTNMFLENNASCSSPNIKIQPFTPGHEADNAWYKWPQDITAFTTHFQFHIDCANVGTSPCGSGIGFESQSNPNYKSTNGGPWTYSADSDQFSWATCHLEINPVRCPFPPAGTNPPAYGFLLGFSMTDYSTSAPANGYKNMVGYFEGPGVYPDNWANNFQNPNALLDMTPWGITLASSPNGTGDLMDVYIIYDGTTISVTITDTVTNAAYTNSWPAHTSAAVLANTSIVGFGSGTATELEDAYIHNWTYTLGQTMAFPATFSIPPAIYTSTQSVALSAPQAGSSIFYTTNGTTPTTSSTPYTAPISVTSTTTIRAIVVVSGFSNSPITAETITINGSATQAANVTYSPAAGSYSGPQTINMSTITSGATIYYTLNGTTPTTASPLAFVSGTNANIYVNQPSETIKAIAATPTLAPSTVTTASYTTSATCLAPTFSPNGGTFSSAQTVTISNPSSCPVVVWSSNGNPETNGATGATIGTVYSGPITVSADSIVYATAGGTAKTDSNASSAPFIFSGSTPTASAPVFSPGAGTYTGTQAVTATNPSSAPTGCYTTNGATPVTNGTTGCTTGTLYSSSISVATSETLKMVWGGTGFSDSGVTSAAYVINTPAVAKGILYNGKLINGSIH